MPKLAFCLAIVVNKVANSFEHCVNKPFPRVYGASDGDVVLHCVDTNSEEAFLAGYTTADSLTGEGSNSKALLIIIDAI